MEALKVCTACRVQLASVPNMSVDTLLLDGGVEDYEYLNKSRREVDGINDHEEWSALKVCSSEATQLRLINVNP